MAGINVPQYDLLKINTAKLRHNKWDLNISKQEAIQCAEVVSLFESQEFRLIAKILGKSTSEIDFMDYILILEIDSITDFNKIVKPSGVTVNGHQFVRFLGTTSGLKNNTIIFVRGDIIGELNERCRCGRKDIPIVPAKLEAYKALTCSASQPICDPAGILVVSDALINIRETVIKIDDSVDAKREGYQDGPALFLDQNAEIENNASDGFNLCTIEYMQKVGQSLGLDYVPSGVCIRNAWVKGMLYPFPILEFAEKYNDGNYIVTDVWGHQKDLRECEMILTESSFKLWAAYESIEDYVDKYHQFGYEFAVTKIAPHVLEDTRELNYQYLQSYKFSDADIEELCKPTVDYLKNACCGDYYSTCRFLGFKSGVEHGTWQEALSLDPTFLGDPYVIESVHRMIRHKIDQAKIGKLIVNGNYQIASGDPFVLMQHICGLPITGLLKAGQIYSKYWADRITNEVVVFRSPMTSHNNIRKCEVVSSAEVDYWYKYMHTIVIINGFDTMCQSLNGCD